MHSVLLLLHSSIVLIHHQCMDILQAIARAAAMPKYLPWGADGMAGQPVHSIPTIRRLAMQAQPMPIMSVIALTVDGCKPCI